MKFIDDIKRELTIYSDAETDLIVLKNNLKNGYYLSLATIGIELVLIAVTFYLRFFVSALKQEHLLQYLIAYMSLIAVSVVTMLVMGRYRRAPEIDAKTASRLQWLIAFYVFFFILWGGYVSILDQASNGHITPFLISIVGCSITFHLHPKRFLVMTTAASLIFIVALYQIQPSLNMFVAHCINTIIFGGFTMLGNYFFYVTYQKSEYFRLQAQALSNRYRTLSQVDPLSGLYNRRMLREYIDYEIIGDHQKLSSIGIALIDIDYFKHYNDHYGHPKGDEVIVALGQLLRELSKAGAVTAFRYGGEEFLLFFKNMSQSVVADTLDLLQRQLANRAIEHTHSQISNWVTLSIGYCVITQINRDKIADYINRADQALLRAKQMGRNRIIRFDFVQD